MLKRENIIKYSQIIIVMLIALLSVDLLKNAYTFLYWVPQGGIPPMYEEWLKYSLLDLLNIYLLWNKRLRLFGFLLLIATMIYGISFLFQTGGENPIMWITLYKSYSMGIMIIAWWIALLLSLVGLFFWWQLYRTSK